MRLLLLVSLALLLPGCATRIEIDKYNDGRAIVTISQGSSKTMFAMSPATEHAEFHISPSVCGDGVNVRCTMEP